MNASNPNVHLYQNGPMCSPVPLPPMTPVNPANPMPMPIQTHDVVYALQQWSGKIVTVQTTRGTLRGMLQEVMPDHVHMHVNGSPFVVRIAEIVWFGPNLSPENQGLYYNPGAHLTTSVPYPPYETFN